MIRIIGSKLIIKNLKEIPQKLNLNKNILTVMMINCSGNLTNIFANQHLSRVKKTFLINYSTFPSNPFEPIEKIKKLNPKTIILSDNVIFTYKKINKVNYFDSTFIKEKILND